ncbi:MAG TPA: hypothetical protein VNG35_16170, partial [Gemmatimonadales bacterium]|nr:hypothetical protein [Gemmatimonadales bacterium]
MMLAAGTCRLERLFEQPTAALLCVTPSLPDTLRDSAARGSLSPRGDTIGIRNCGGGELRWRAVVQQGSSWVAILPDSGEAGHGAAPTVVFNAATLTLGTYHETIVVRSTNGSGLADVPVSFVIQPCSVTPLRLDDSATAALTLADCGAPHRLGSVARVFSFPGTRNDSASLELAADYDAYLVLDTTLDAARPPLAETHNCLGITGEPCLYYQRLPLNTTYAIEVTSAAAADSGTFTLRLVHPRLPTAPGGLDQVLLDSVTSVSPGATVSQASLLLRAAVTDPDRGDQLHLEGEVRPVGTGFSGPNVPDGAAVANGGVAWVLVTGLSDKTAYRWRVRAADNTGRSGPWAAFGGSPDFVINILHPPSAPTTLGQARPDGSGIITGATIDTNVVLLSGVVSDADPGDSLRLVVEVRPVGTAFFAPTDSSPAVLNGGALQVRVGSLPGATSYHWQARAVDQTGSPGPWVSYGGNAETATDFGIAVLHDPYPPGALAQLQSGSLVPIPVGGIPQSGTVVIQGTLSDPDAGQNVQLDVEVEPVGQNFADQPNYHGAPVPSGKTTRVTVGPFAQDTGYHWQARARDATGNISAWVAFPISPPNPESDADFRYPSLPAFQLVFTVQPKNAKAGMPIAPPVQVTVR